MLRDVLKQWLVISFVISQVSCRLARDQTKIAVVTVDTSHSINCVEADFLSFTIDSNVFQPNIHWYKFNIT